MPDYDLMARKSLAKAGGAPTKSEPKVKSPAYSGKEMAAAAQKMADLKLKGAKSTPRKVSK